MKVLTLPRAVAVAPFAALVLAFASVSMQFSPTTAAAPTPVVVMGAGDIAEAGSSTMTNAESTGDLIREAAPDVALVLGDNAYPDGSASDYSSKYDPTWGSFKSITKPVPGNHEYHADPPAGYLGYFGSARATNPVDGGVYYSYDVGDGWRAYALNSEISMSASSPQYAWLKADLAAHPGVHVLAYWHQPRYTSPSEHGDDTSAAPIWALLESAHADLVLQGHNHNYERFAKMNSTGGLDAGGIRSFVVGTGGNQTYTRTGTHAGSEAFNGTDYGVIKLSLFTDHYEWQWIESGRGFDGSTSVDTGHKGVVFDSGSDLTNLGPGAGSSTTTTTTTTTGPSDTTSSTTSASSTSSSSTPTSPSTTVPSSTTTASSTTTPPTTGQGPLHFLANESGAYATTHALGYTIHDVGTSDSALDDLPSGDKGLVWIGMDKNTCAPPNGATAFITANVANPRVYGYFLLDEPSNGNCVAAVRALADAIPSGQKALVELTDYPGTYADYAPAESHLDLVALDPYPCHDGTCDLSEINTQVAAARAAGISEEQLVPTFQVFGGQGWDAPTAAQLQSILDRWHTVLPDPPLEYTYSWSTQGGSLTDALATRDDWQSVMKAHNAGTPGPTPTTTSSTTRTTTTGTPTTSSTSASTPATALDCPLLASPTVGEALTCTYR